MGDPMVPDDALQLLLLEAAVDFAGTSMTEEARTRFVRRLCALFLIRDQLVDGEEEPG